MGEGHAGDSHPHVHGSRPLLVGALHGLAGSASLVLLVASATRSPLSALAYIGLFGLGSILGMTALAGALSLPLRATASGSALLHAALHVLVGACSAALGLRILWQLGS